MKKLGPHSKILYTSKVIKIYEEKLKKKDEMKYLMITNDMLYQLKDSWPGNKMKVNKTFLLRDI